MVNKKISNIIIKKTTDEFLLSNFYFIIMRALARDKVGANPKVTQSEADIVQSPSNLIKIEFYFKI